MVTPEKFPKSFFFHLNVRQALCACACPDGHAPPFNWKKMLFGNILSEKIHFVKSQGIYLESGLVSAFNGWTSQKMHEILLCLKFEAVVDVLWKLFLACLITWMPNFFQIKYFDVDRHGAFDSGGVYFISRCQRIYFSLSERILSVGHIRNGCKTLGWYHIKRTWNSKTMCGIEKIFYLKEV